MSLFTLSVLLLCAVGGATSLVVIWLDGLKSRLPGLFTPSSTAPGTPPAPGAPAPAPAKPPTGGAATGTPKEIAAEMFRRRGLPTRSEKTAA